jgi:hypothetical protein
MQDFELSDLPQSTPVIAKQPMSRLRAAAIHLAISLVIGLLVVALMWFVWYPSPYFYGMGGLGLLLLLVSVDVVIGPLITLVIFNPAKKSLKFDLAVVAALQIAALVYGVYVMAQARPVYVVFSEARFDVVIAADMSAAEQAKVNDERFKQVSWTGPQLAALDIPKDSAELSRMLTSGVNSRAFSQYYVPYQDRAKQAASAAKPINFLAFGWPDAAKAARAFIASKGIEESQVVWLPLYTRANDMTMLLKRDTGEILAVLPVRSEL